MFFQQLFIFLVWYFFTMTSREMSVRVKAAVVLDIVQLSWTAFQVLLYKNI